MKVGIVLLLLGAMALAISGPALCAPDSFFDIFLESVTIGPPYPTTPHIQGASGYANGGGGYTICSFFDVWLESCGNGGGGGTLPAHVSASDSGGGIGLFGIDSFFDVYCDSLTYMAPDSFFDVFLECAGPGGTGVGVPDVTCSISPDGYFVIGMTSVAPGAVSTTQINWQLTQPGWTFDPTSTATLLPDGHGIAMSLKVNSPGQGAPSVPIIRGTMTGTTTPVPEPSSILAVLTGVGALCGSLIRRRR